MIRSKARKIYALSLISIALLMSCGLVYPQSFSHILSFQGRLADPNTGKPLPDGQYQVQFTIYDTPTGGRSLWKEIQSVDQAGGIFDVYLGTVTEFPSDLFTDGDRWLALQLIGDDEMTERFQLAPSPQAIYAADSAHAAASDHATEADHATDADHAADADAALYADDADTVDGLHGGAFVLLAPGGKQTEAAVDLAGTEGQPACKLQNSGVAFAAATTTEEMDWWWGRKYPPNSPTGRSGLAMAYDKWSDRVILFGGYDGKYLNDTWAYDLNTNTWTNMSPDSSPAARHCHAMAYDIESDRVILFGGHDGTYYYGDTWAYDWDTNTWTQMSPASWPNVRLSHAMAYDSESERVILYGGYDGTYYYGDTWTYDWNRDTWTQMSPPSWPEVRCGQAMAYDAGSDRVVLFGGRYGSSHMVDTWAYDCNTDTWTPMRPSTFPSARSYHAMVYHTERDCAILFGGIDPSSYFADTWTYDLDADAWTQVSLIDSPSVRSIHAMAFDSESGCAILFGGYDGGSSRLDDTWVFGLYNTVPVAEFDGSVHVRGGLMVEGEKNAVVPTASFGERKVYCQESTEVWFEHIGSAKLVNGPATIELDPIFLETVTIDDTHPMRVFITPTSDIDRYFVTKGRDSFTVVSKTNRIGTFDYRVVAKRRGWENAFMEPMER